MGFAAFYCKDQVQHSIINQFVNKTRTAYIKLVRFYIREVLSVSSTKR